MRGGGRRGREGGEEVQWGREGGREGERRGEGVRGVGRGVVSERERKKERKRVITHLKCPWVGAQIASNSRSAGRGLSSCTVGACRGSRQRGWSQMRTPPGG